MSIYYCKTCKDAFLPEQTLTYENLFFCNKCNLPLVTLGAEQARVSLKAHLESSSPTKNSEPLTNPKNPKSYNVKQKDAVLIECETMLAANPLNVDALFTLSKWYYSHGLTDESQAIAKQILSIDPNHDATHTFLSEQAESGTTLPKNVATLEQMAINLINKGKLNETEPIFKKVLTIDPNHIAAHRYLTEYYTEKNQHAEAIHHLSILTMRIPNDPRILFNLAVACYNAGDMGRAKSNAKAAYLYCKEPDLQSEISALMDVLGAV